MHKYQRTAVQEHGKEGDIDIKSIISKLSEMRYRLMTDKSLVDFDANHIDASIWNGLLDEFRRKISLWGNKADLSLSGSDPHQMSSTIFHRLEELESKILVNDLEKTCDTYLISKEEKQVDIILDNAGLELFCDLCVSELLRFQNLAKKVVFHGKVMPWFVSDTTSSDLEWTLHSLEMSENENLRELGKRWRKRFGDGDFEFRAHPFWTYSFPYYEMERRSPELYSELGKSNFLIFKGDLNYRKIVADLEWPIDTPFRTSLNGFEPNSFIVLRTLKAEVVTGLSKDSLNYIANNFEKDDKSWMVSSDYAVAQLFEKKK